MSETSIAPPRPRFSTEPHVPTASQSGRDTEQAVRAPGGRGGGVEEGHCQYRLLTYLVPELVPLYA